MTMARPVHGPWPFGGAAGWPACVGNGGRLWRRPRPAALFLCPMPLVPPCPGLSPAYGCRGVEAWMEQDEGLPAVGAYACLMLAGSFSHLSGMLFSARPRRGTPCIRPRRRPVPAPARQHWWWLLEAFFAKCRGIGLCLHNSLCARWLAKRPVLQCRTGRFAGPYGPY